MHLAAYIGLLFSLLVTLAVAGYACLGAWQDNEDSLKIVEFGQFLSAFLVSMSAVILLGALMGRDYSFLYVFENVDNSLPMLYRFTAFWAGRTGSLLFWHLIIAVAGAVFVFTLGYREFKPRTRLTFWVFFLSVEGFFLLLLTCWSNPFMGAVPTPLDGLGLNPLLQNLGMAFHPPLLFLGYGLFTIPACAALAAMLTGEPRSWIKICRNWNLIAWASLTGGIILGAWWSYMELGWGGYWAWDPVENASLIPWFASTAFLHTGIIEAKRGALQRSNVFLMALTFLLCIFATYLVRSGVDVQSLHTFGEGGVAMPLTIFMLAGLGLAIAVPFLGEQPDYRALFGFASRQGLLVIVCWVMISLGLVVGMGTMWPVLSKLWSQVPVALDQAFYNRVCLPLFTLIMLLFCVCPWLDWKDGVRNLAGLTATAGAFAGAVVMLYFTGVTDPLPLVSAAAAVAGMVSLVLLFALIPALRRSRHSWGVYAIHLGLALMVLGVAFSGPYKVEVEAQLDKGQSMQLGKYTLVNRGILESDDGKVKVYTADIAVMLDGEPVAVMTPERRWYPNSKNSFAEVSVVPSLGDELYATLLGYDLNKGAASLKASLNPLINWIWIGGTIMCLAPLFILRRRGNG